MDDTSAPTPDVSRTEPDPGGNPDWSPWVLLLIVPVVIPLLPWLFNSVDPTFFGMPAFYWVQLAFVLLSAIVTGFVYLMTRKGR